MTTITLYDRTTLCAAFPYRADRVAAIKTLPERRFEPDLKAWLVPVSHFEQLLEVLPDAGVHPDVWETVYPTLAMRLADTLGYCRRLNASGVRLVVRDGRIVAEHDYADPKDIKALQKHVDERAGDIWRLLVRGHRFDRAAQPPDTKPVPAPESEQQPLFEPADLAEPDQRMVEYMAMVRQNMGRWAKKAERKSQGKGRRRRAR